MIGDFCGVLDVPADARVAVREHLGLEELDRLRVAYIPGPGDVTGTFAYWLAGRHDPRVPTIAYSLMFYELMERLHADCLTIALHSGNNVRGISNSRYRFEQLAPAKTSGRWSFFWRQIWFARDVLNIVNQFDPHIVISSTHNPVISWSRLSNGRRLVISAHNSFWPMGQQPESIRGRLRAAFLRSQAHAIDAAICTSRECFSQIGLLTGGRVLGEVECPQIVDRYKIEVRSRVRNLLFLGRIESAKGVFLLLDVFEAIASSYLDLRLTFAGSGQSERALEDRICQSHFSDRIRFCGSLDSAGVHDIIALSDLVICPTMTSFNEGLAVVGFEAAAHGIPTIVSSVVPAAELLGASCSVYAADEPDCLREMLCELIEDPQVYRSRCLATASVRDLIYDRSLSWGSGLFRAIMAS